MISTEKIGGEANNVKNDQNTDYGRGKLLQDILGAWLLGFCAWLGAQGGKEKMWDISPNSTFSSLAKGAWSTQKDPV